LISALFSSINRPSPIEVSPSILHTGQHRIAENHKFTAYASKPFQSFQVDQGRVAGNTEYTPDGGDPF